MKNLFVRQNNFKLTEEEPAGEIIELKIAAAMKIKWIYKGYIYRKKVKNDIYYGKRKRPAEADAEIQCGKYNYSKY